MKEQKKVGRPKIDKVRSFLIRRRNNLKIVRVAEQANCTKENIYMFMKGSNLSESRRELVIEYIKKHGYKP